MTFNNTGRTLVMETLTLVLTGQIAPTYLN